MAKEFGDPWEGRDHFKKPSRPSATVTSLRVSQIARWLAAMEAMTGLLYVAVPIARLFRLIRGI